MFAWPPIIVLIFEEGITKMDFISVADAAIKWELSERRVQKLCKENRIDGAVFFRRIWIIPKDAKKPIDGRYKKISNQSDTVM